MSELLHDLGEQLARLVGVSPGDLRDEHVRWGIYQKVMELPRARGLLLRAVYAESDANLASSVVLCVIESLDEEERAEWINSLRDDKRAYAYRRGQELSILERIVAGHVDADEVNENIGAWTDWLQLRIAESAVNLRILDIVSEAGRTRRIRAIAKDRRARIERP